MSRLGVTTNVFVSMRLNGPSSGRQAGFKVYAHCQITPPGSLKVIVSSSDREMAMLFVTSVASSPPRVPPTSVWPKMKLPATLVATSRRKLSLAVSESELSKPAVYLNSCPPFEYPT
eukprot:CAMPEP_0185514990 /NCGR_PEP_ID=MMETSP1366-20130426/61178_1 /TAXON_ID=38817 /ORGANISM="Gephyrocapsa oceanica, Strain RCC1303" /LENGTH=116 /DNA_ID=CAMNT_0028125819 /DNA_START=352 /DNA_END=702 /DNA_ORIENTATION=+